MPRSTQIATLAGGISQRPLFLLMKKSHSWDLIDRPVPRLYYTVPSSELQAAKGENHVIRNNKLPLLKRRSETHSGGKPDERQLVARSIEPEDAAPALAIIQSHGRGVQLCRGIQEPGPGRRDQGPPCLDDHLAGLVARGLRPLWAVRSEERRVGKEG